VIGPGAQPWPARLFRACLRLYPAGFRAEFGEEMLEVFDRQRQSAAGAAGQGLRQRVARLQQRRPLMAQTSAGARLFSPSRRIRDFVIPAVLLMAALAYVVWWVYAFATYGFNRPPRVQQAALADLTGDGNLDVYLAIGPGGEPYQHPDYVLFGDGRGGFVDSGQELGTSDSSTVSLGDLNGDGFVDAVEGLTVRWNNGAGIFVGSYPLTGFHDGASPGPDGVMRLRPVLGDLNGDGRLDVFAAGCCGRPGEYGDGGEYQPPYSLVWLHESDNLLRPAQKVGDAPSNAAALADLNGDGALDVFLANGRLLGFRSLGPETPNTVWFNDGQGHFTDSGQRLGLADSTAVALGDLNGDGYLDAVVGNRGADEVWFNDEHGNFSDSGQRLGSGPTRAMLLADFNGDGRLDMFAAGDSDGRVWLNEGAGRLRAGQRISFSEDSAAAAGDLDGDGRVDILVVGVGTYQVWLNEGDGQFAASPLTIYR
jgi:hypothetical protein